MSSNFRMLPAAILIFLTACDGPASTPSEAPVEGLSILEPGCYLGHQSAGGDSILLRIETVNGLELSGNLLITIPEKDRRTGTFRGTLGTDGVVRAAYTFMQEGVTDSIHLQFMRDSESGTGLALRPPAYDPGSGREYPDSSKPFTIRLRKQACEASPQ